MYAVTGVSGKVGGATAHALREMGLAVRAIVRDAAKGATWRERGAEVALADLNDPTALAAAFAGAEGVFALLPPLFDPTPGFPEARAFAASIRRAVEIAKPPKLVCLSTIGAQATQPNLLSQLGLVEQALADAPVPVCFLRAAWFMDNSASDIPAARETGVVPSFLQPLDKPVPMVATDDIGDLAASLLRETWTGRRVVELEGPRRVTPNEVGAALAKVLGRPVRMETAPRETWEGLFTAQGMKNPRPRAQMLDGFNEGWIEFEAGQAGSLKGRTGIETVLARLAAEG